jgi:ribonuclease HI
LSKIEELVEEIRGLEPAQRHQLLRRLRINGLLSPLEAVADRRRLEVAPAVSRSRTGAGSGFVSPADPQEPASHASGTLDTAEVPDTTEVEGYRSPVSGRSVVGSPKAGEDTSGEMAPLPGRAPERPIRIVFDGGSRGNPGQGYGSYAVDWPGRQTQIVRLQFGERVTNNEAEYDTLISALEAMMSRMQEAGIDPETAKFEIRGDSQLVVNQVNGEWQCKEARLRARRDQVRALLDRLGAWQLQFHGRENSVKILGH